jgi:hypothetical protein
MVLGLAVGVRMSEIVILLPGNSTLSDKGSVVHADMVRSSFD